MITEVKVQRYKIYGFFILIFIMAPSVQGFSLNNNCPQFCIQCDYISKVCNQCQQGYILNILKNQCERVLNKKQTSFHDLVTQGQKSQKFSNNQKNLLFHEKQKIIRKLIQIPFCIQVQESFPQICKSCQKGYKLIDNYCQQKIKNCQKYDDSELFCLSCKDQLTLQGNVCIDFYCTVMLFGTASCVQCDVGYALNKNNNCVKNSIQHCILVENNTCSKCQKGYHFIKQKLICIKQPQYCNLFEQQTYECVQCRHGFYLNQQKTCQKNKLDPNCKRFQEEICKQCADRYYFSQNFTCVPVNPLCKSYDRRGKCTQCFLGYTFNIESDMCTVSKISYCKTQVTDGHCLECFNGFYLNSSYLCQMVNPLCKTYDRLTGWCLSCYVGYKLIENACRIYYEDPNCKEYNGEEKCVQCYKRYYLNGSKCALVSPLCKQYDSITGLCTSCYYGYSLIDGTCKVSTVQAIKNCKVQQNQVCIACSDSYYFDLNLNCVQRNPLCKTFNPTNGFCTSCYNGYQLSQNLCIIPTKPSIPTNSATQQTNTTKNCMKLKNSSFCQTCYQGYIIQNGKCIESNLNCKSFNQQKNGCLTCYSGYIVYNSKCLTMNEILSQLSNIQNCLKSQNDVCLLCKEGFKLDQKGQCE